jgi:hypothetical protein
MPFSASFLQGRLGCVRWDFGAAKSVDDDDPNRTSGESDGLDDRRHKHPDNRHDVCFNQSRVAGNLGGMAVPTQIVMDHTGDTRHHFDAKDSHALAKAEERFNELMRLGFTAAVRTAASEVARVRSFDPTAEETLFFPRLVGG